MLIGLIVCLAVFAAATVLGYGWRRRSGALRLVGHAGVREAAGSADAGDAARPAGAARRRGGPLTGPQLGSPLGERATLVQFSTAFCAPCRATRRILAEVAAVVEGVTHVEIDAGSNLALVRALGISSTPTVLVLAPDGAVVRRGTGQPRKADVLAAVAAAESGQTAHGRAVTGG